MAQQEQERPVYKAVQEGSRWIDNPPSPEEFAEWFVHNVPVHEELKDRKEEYAGGITLISADETVKRTKPDGAVDEFKRQVFVPYAKVETRVAYFQDLCAAKGWRGAIEPDDVARIAFAADRGGIVNEHLPPGFFRMPVGTPDGKQAHFLCCSMRVRAYKRDAALTPEQESRWPQSSERLVLSGAPGTKQVSLLDRYDKVDPNAIMKAQTGAVGRALGFAGMLVIPGSGVATAEDILEARSGDGVGSTPELPAAPGEQASLPADEAAPAETLRARVERLIDELANEHPEQHKALQAWAREKKLTLAAGNLADSQLRTILRRVETLIAEAT